MNLNEKPRLLVRRTLVVGLGGTGCRTVQETINRIKQRFRGRRPKFCEFLALDTTAEEVQNDEQLNISDFAHIGGFDGNRYFEHLDRYDFLKWLPSNKFRPGEINVGAQGIPQLGRFCYMMKREGIIYPAVERKLYALNDPNLPNSLTSLDPEWDISLDRNAGIWIHLVTSLCGGTGAGCLLDTANDLRYWCEQITGRRPRIIAHLVMPETFRKCSDATRRHFRAITYSMLTQICHLMGRNKETIRYKDGTEQDWGETEMPFDFCFLLGGTSEKNSIDRDTWSNYIGRMISLLATERAGKVLMDQMINVYPRQESQQRQEAKFEEMRIFSSYGLATGVRPEGAADRAIRSAALQQFAELAKTPPHAGLIDGAMDPYETRLQAFETAVISDVGQRKKKFRETFSNKRDQANSPQSPMTAADFAKWFREASRTMHQDLVDEAKRTAEVLAPLPHRHTADSEEIRAFLALWIETPGEGVDALQSQVQELTDHLQERALEFGDSTQTETVWTDITKRLSADADEMAVLQHAEETMTLIDAWFDLVVRTTWHQRRQNIIEAFTSQLDSLRRNLTRIGDQCQARYDALHEHSVSGVENDDNRQAHINLFSVDADVLLQQPWVRSHSQRLLKRLLTRLVTSHSPIKNYSYEVEELLRDDRELQPEVAELRINLIKGFENRTAEADDQLINSDLNSKLKDCYESADPYWLVQIHKTVEEVACVVYPGDTTYGRAVHQMVDEQVHEFPEDHQDDVLICRTQHGAALRDMRNFQQYEQTYFEMLKRRGKLIEEGAERLDPEMSLDVNWVVRRPPRANVEQEVKDRGPLTFACLNYLQPEGLPVIQPVNQVYTWTNSAGENPEPLGKGFVNAYRIWCTKHELIDHSFETIETECDPATLPEQAQELLDFLRQEEKSEEGEQKEIYSEMCRAVEHALVLWQETADELRKKKQLRSETTRSTKKGTKQEQTQ